MSDTRLSNEAVESIVLAHPDLVKQIEESRAARQRGEAPTPWRELQAQSRSGAAARPIAVDLFAGAGGMSLGFEQAGFYIAAAVEHDPVHAAIHELNFPHTRTLCRDVRSLSGEDIRREACVTASDIDVVFGGPPCQGFSMMGHRALDDPRNELITHFLRLVQELQPKAFVMENVPGMAAGSHAQFIDELITGFEAIGYSVRAPHKILNAAYFGVPQDRKRLFLLGARSDVRLAEYPDELTYPAFGRHGQCVTAAPGLVPTPTVIDAIGDLPNIDDFECLLTGDVLSTALGEASLYASILRGDEIDPADYSCPRIYDLGSITGCRRAAHTPVSRDRFAATELGTTERISHFYRLHPQGVCNTLRAGTASDRGAFTAPRPIHPVYPRCISVREAARLHSFPDWFRLHATIWHGFRQIGNSVPPLLARAVGRCVMTALGVQPVRPQIPVRLGSDEPAHLNMREAAARYGVSRTTIPPRQRTPALKAKSEVVPGGHSE